MTKSIVVSVVAVMLTLGGMCFAEDSHPPVATVPIVALTSSPSSTVTANVTVNNYYGDCREAVRANTGAMELAEEAEPLEEVQEEPEASPQPDQVEQEPVSQPVPQPTPQAPSASAKTLEPTGVAQAPSQVQEEVIIYDEPPPPATMLVEMSPEVLCRSMYWHHGRYWQYNRSRRCYAAVTDRYAIDCYSRHSLHPRQEWYGNSTGGGYHPAQRTPSHPIGVTPTRPGRFVAPSHRGDTPMSGPSAGRPIVSNPHRGGTPIDGAHRVEHRVTSAGSGRGDRIMTAVRQPQRMATQKPAMRQVNQGQRVEARGIAQTRQGRPTHR